MKAWDQFLKDVRPFVPGCPEVVAEHAVLRAAQEFFEATRVWKTWLPDMDTSLDASGTGVMEYPLLLEANSELVRIECATLEGRELPVLSEDELPIDWKTYPSQAPDSIHTTDRETLVLLPPPADAQTLKVQVSLKPAESATGIENHLFDQYVKKIAAGAVAILKEHEKASYSDPAGAQVWRGKFEGFIAEVDFQRFRGFSSARPRRPIKTF
jgi:hypothetical protein